MTELSKPIHEGGRTISNKPWGIACYRLAPCHKRVKHWLYGYRYVRTDTYNWSHSHDMHYKQKRSQLQALEDLIKRYPDFKFVPFKNNFKELPEKRIKNLRTITLP